MFIHAPIVAAAGNIPDLHTEGLISAWSFTEGNGTTVNDDVGSNDINLNLPTTPNYTWNSKGILLASGLVQTPAIAGARTVAFLYRVGRGETSGMALSGGASSGVNVLAQGASIVNTLHVGVGNGVRTFARRADTGGNAYALNRESWKVGFCQFDAAYTTALGFGGRHSTTTSRCTDYEIAWAGVYNDTLNTAERTKIYRYLRTIAKARGFYIDYRDCPIQVDGVLLWGQSNADGRAKIADLSAPDQARSISKSYIEPANSTSSVTYPPALMVVGTNQQKTAPATDFGPETAMAWRRDDSPSATRLYFGKTARGSTALSPTSVNGLTSTEVWNTAELPSSGLFYHALLWAYDLEAHSLANGVGINWRALFWMQGERDATNTTWAASYQADLQSLYDKTVEYLNAPGLKAIIGRIRDQDPNMDAQAAIDVRAAQAAFVAENPSYATLINTDSFPLSMADNVHYTAAGMKSLGEAFYDVMPW